MNSFPHSRMGFSLIEVLIALGVTTFCLISIMGLLLVGLKGAQATSEQTAAVGIAMDVISDLKAAPTGTTSPQFGITVPAAGGAASTSPTSLYIEEGGLSDGNALGPNSRYRVSLGFTPPPSGQKAATSVRIMVSWPAQADPSPSAWATHYLGSWETVVQLDEN